MPRYCCRKERQLRHAMRILCYDTLRRAFTARVAASQRRQLPTSLFLRDMLRVYLIDVYASCVATFMLR